MCRWICSSGTGSHEDQPGGGRGSGAEQAVGAVVTCGANAGRSSGN